MPRNRSGIVKRAETILESLLQRDYISVVELSEILNVSRATVRKDLDRLERQGVLRRTHGGAMPMEPMFYEPFLTDPTFAENQTRHIEEKRAIGLAAARMVRDGDTIGFTGGTTATQVARSLHNRRDITVITNAINIVMELSNRKHMTVFVPGGFLRGGMFALTGMNGINAVTEFMIDKVFIGVNGIHPLHGLTTTYIDHAAFLRAMIRQARQKIVIADHSKIGAIHKAFICHSEDVDCIITDPLASQEVLQQFRDQGIEIVLVN